MVTVEQIIEHFGSKRALADLLEVSPQALTRWNSEGVPAKAAIQIERFTDGKFKAIDIPIYGTTKEAQQLIQGAQSETNNQAA